MQVGLVVGQENIELREFPEPQPDVGRAVVEISYCGICGTDLHAYHGGGPYNPAICGHEWSGTLVSKGKDVKDLHEGDRVGIGVGPKLWVADDEARLSGHLIKLPAKELTPHAIRRLACGGAVVTSWPL